MGFAYLWTVMLLSHTKYCVSFFFCWCFALNTLEVSLWHCFVCTFFFQSLRKVGQDPIVLLMCITVFLSYLPEAGQYSCMFLYLKQVSHLDSFLDCQKLYHNLICINTINYCFQEFKFRAHWSCSYIYSVTGYKIYCWRCGNIYSSVRSFISYFSGNNHRVW